MLGWAVEKKNIIPKRVLPQIIHKYGVFVKWITDKNHKLERR